MVNYTKISMKVRLSDAHPAGGVYRSASSEIVETEKYALVYSCSPDRVRLRTELYVQSEGQKRLSAICEYDGPTQKTSYAYQAGTLCLTNDDRLKGRMGEGYDAEQTKSMKCKERFMVRSGGGVLPTVGEAGIKKCLMLWRMADSVIATPEWFQIFLCTGRTEYIFSIRPQDTDIYCGASYNVPFDLGLYSAGQFFRLRNYRDNSAPFCAFFCDFTCEPTQEAPMNEPCRLEKCADTDQGLIWYVKRYTDEEIVLQGCGEDEYIYRRRDERKEVFFPYYQ